MVFTIRGLKNRAYFACAVDHNDQQQPDKQPVLHFCRTLLDERVTQTAKGKQERGNQYSRFMQLLDVIRHKHPLPLPNSDAIGFQDFPGDRFRKIISLQIICTQFFQ